ncbi:MAG: bacillithiol biosynthesis deacetylase BshB1 [Candidatus Helarchaeota archaeon]|nr:bacillithiol biosynthesis deacetylase BshB1 [Candidatus Helarchaeota archaeon]
MAFGAHPDDVELRCAGTLIKLAKKGHKTVVVDITQGEFGSRGSPQKRIKESKKALNVMGLNLRENLKIPDTNIEINEGNKIRVINVIRKYKPEIVFLPYWDDRHPDHANASKLINDASFYSGLKSIKTDYESFKPIYNIYYMCHYTFEPTFIVDISDVFEKKIKAIKAYKSQFEVNKDTELDDLIKSPFSVENLEAKDRFYGSLIGVRYGEPFLLRNPVKTSDPINLLFS